MLNITLLNDMYNRGKNINMINKVICLSLSTYISDIITALIHCYITDRGLFGKNNTYIDKPTKKIIMHIGSGYGSAHHLFPSNYIDIDDKIIIRDIFIIGIPYFVLNFLNKNDTTAYLNYAILYQMCASGITHKYAHERNHNRYVPKPIEILQDLGLSLSSKIHKNHHEKLDCDYATYNGMSNKFINILTKKIDKLLNIQPFEEVIDLCKKYVKKYGKDITIKFVGDIEGEIIVNLKGNIFKHKKNT
jgi:hypothetical protein